MKDLNSLNISGRLVKDCETKELSKHNLLSFTIASNYTIKRGDEWVDETNFIDVKFWTNHKSPIGDWLLKGVKVIITGEIRQERWEDNNGKQARKIILQAKDVMVLKRPEEGESASDTKQSRPSSAKKASSVSAPLDDDDIPF